MPIQVTTHRDPEPLDLAAFVQLAEFVLDRADAPKEGELSIAIISVEEMTELNLNYRDKEGPTDVLAFPCDDPCPLGAGEPLTLGDVVISPEVAADQAAELGHTIEEELNLLLVHGILHILGYEHDTDEGAGAMQAREKMLLEAYAEGL